MSSGGRSEVKVPALGESIREATVARWLKSVGDPVKVDEVLVELDTDKVTVEISAPASGTLMEVLVGKGSTVSVGEVLWLVSPGDTIRQEDTFDRLLLVRLCRRIQAWTGNHGHRCH